MTQELQKSKRLLLERSADVVAKAGDTSLKAGAIWLLASQIGMSVEDVEAYVDLRFQLNCFHSGQQNALPLPSPTEKE